MENHLLTKKVSTIVVSRPGVMRQALETLLALAPQIEITGVVAGGMSAMNLISSNPPALLIIDSGLPEDELTALLQHVKQKQPQVRCLVLTETTRQKDSALALGADVVILRSEPTERLVDALDRIGLW